MSSLEHAQLSALADAAADLAHRAAEMAEVLDDGIRSDAANALFEAERSMDMARRALDRARAALPS